jgi:hypothetical protein
MYQFLQSENNLIFLKSLLRIQTILLVMLLIDNIKFNKFKSYMHFKECMRDSG